MLKPVLINLFTDYAGPLCGGHQRHERGLKIGREARERLGGDVDRLDVTGGDGDSCLIDLQLAATVPQLLQNSTEVLRNHRFHPQR